MNSNLPGWARWLDVLRNPKGEPVRHIVLFGGRGGAKSWTIAHKLVERAMTRKARILCTREFQNSIKDSSKKLIEDCIDRLGFGAAGNGFFTVTETEIRGRNGSHFIFFGLNGKEAALKSFEGIDVVWVEEAATVTQASIDALVPTIRREGSQIWWSFNPRHPTDPVDAMFRCDNPPPGSVIREVHWRDYPWFPAVLKRDMEYDRERDPEKYAHIWEGRYLTRSDARVFSRWWRTSFETPDDAIFRFGADWGFNIDPTVLVRCFLGKWSAEPGDSEVIADRKGNCLFVDHEAYRVRCSLDDTPALFAGSDSRSRWPNRFGFPGVPGAARTKIVADSARPETIDYLKKLGFQIEPAIKGPRSVEEGIEFLQKFDIYVHPRCTHLVDELTHYSWKVDRQTSEMLSKLADADNHVIDALRYALEGVRKAGSGSFSFMRSGPRVSIPPSSYDFSPPPGQMPEELRRGSLGRGFGSAPSPFKRGWY